jgi:hypothetical protein
MTKQNIVFEQLEPSFDCKILTDKIIVGLKEGEEMGGWKDGGHILKLESLICRMSGIRGGICTFMLRTPYLTIYLQ